MQENIVKVGPAIDQNTGKASLKAKKMFDPQDEVRHTENEGKDVNISSPLGNIQSVFI